jgi:hypothetical protein
MKDITGWQVVFRDLNELALDSETVKMSGNNGQFQCDNSAGSRVQLHPFRLIVQNLH